MPLRGKCLVQLLREKSRTISLAFSQWQVWFLLCPSVTVFASTIVLTFEITAAMPSYLRIQCANIIRPEDLYMTITANGMLTQDMIRLH